MALPYRAAGKRQGALSRTGGKKIHNEFLWIEILPLRTILQRNKSKEYFA
jgi:hypothetical protein